MAWRRINTARIPSHKRFFRAVYLGYEAGLERNLGDLSRRLQGSWQSSNHTRFFTPKSTGLHRPFSILEVEDQIVLQALANLFAKKMRRRRNLVERRVVFSNILNPDEDAVFFVEDWRQTHRLLAKRADKFFQRGLTWVAFFDLTEFYETISHDVLLSVLGGSLGSGDQASLPRSWLRSWNSGSQDGLVAHGIPQGPAASDFLAECVLLAIDEYMQKGRVPYLRYVDDIRVLGSTRAEVVERAFELERRCRRLGLFPSGSKFKIREVKSAEEIIRGFDYYYYSGTRGPKRRMPRKRAETLLKEAVRGRPRLIQDKAVARYVFYNAPKSRSILALAKTLLPRHPEHVDALLAYIATHERAPTVERLCLALLWQPSTPAYVRGELWHLLAQKASAATLVAGLPLAQKEVRRGRGAFSLEWGASNFILRCRELGFTSAAAFIPKQNPLVQALIVPRLLDADYAASGIVAKMLRSKHPAPGLALAPQLIVRKKSHLSFGIPANALPRQVQNAFRGLGVLGRTRPDRVDPIGEILQRRYRLENSVGWRKLLRSEYVYALSLLLQAEGAFKAGRSVWLQFQNHFNEVLFKSTQRCLEAAGQPFTPLFSQKKKETRDYGKIVQDREPFSLAFPEVATPFREVNKRRNRLPGSHPYTTKGERNKYLDASEQRQFVKGLRAAYARLGQVSSAL